MCLFIGALLATPQARAADETFSGGLSLLLDAAVAKQQPEKTIKMNRLRLMLEAEQGRWQTVWGYGERFNRGDHSGRVAQSACAADSIRLRVEMKIEGDPWVPGGRAIYEVELKRSGATLEGTYRGTFHGRYRDDALRGAVRGEVLPPRPKPAADFAPVQAGEHPRILFRKKDLPALQARAATPFGKPLVERLKAAEKHAVALGMMYQLTGDKAYAERAIPVIEGMRKNGYHNGANNLPEPWGYNVARIAMAYDLCYDAWTEEYRRDLAWHLAGVANRLLLRPNTVSQKMNWDPGSNYQPGTRGGAAIATLALWGDRGPAPVAPPDPLSELVRLAPPADFVPGKGVKPQAVESGATPSDWLVLGPIAGRLGEGGRLDSRIRPTSHRRRRAEEAPSDDPE